MTNRDIIKFPSVTEKNNIQRLNQNKYAFIVHTDSNKIQIQKAVQSIFGVKVVSVNTQSRIGKLKRTGRYEGRRSSWKKAIVTIEKGQNIPIFEGA
ncbi:MAG: 50S ribosomal protein L23 [Fibrobacteres bacterium]|nr:50S ribosomal protein L23 [Fibrobacterota bacterium]